ncbi:MAG TPA: TIM barrel protein, partial [Candidatus Wallbacteria bacterium]|nr:TIM barrel protein [Candidatus Wallbacteria bacterium]
AVRRKAIDLHRAALQRVAWLGCRTMLFVPGAVIVPWDPSYKPVRYDQAVAWAREAVAELARTAAAVGVDLGVENVWNGLFYSPMEFAAFIDSFDHPRVGVYFEAAAVDGAGPVRTFVKITFPLLLPQTMFLAISLTIDAMQVFAPVMLLTEGGPANSSEVVMHRVYKEAFNNLNMGAASAMSLILFVFILAASVLQYKYFKYDY